MTLTDCMKAASHGRGYDCRHCGLHLDQCVQEDDLHLQDERYQLEAELTKSKNGGRALTTTAHRTLHFSDAARQLHAMEAATDGRRSPPVISRSEPARHPLLSQNSSLFADAPLSNARQPELKTFTFKEESVDAPLTVTDHTVVYQKLPVNTSPRFSLRTIARAVVASSTASEADSDDTCSELESTTERNVDWPDPPEQWYSEISVDGPPLRRWDRNGVRPANKPRFSGNIRNDKASVIYVRGGSGLGSSDSDGAERSSTSSDDLSTESGEYSVVDQESIAKSVDSRVPVVEGKLSSILNGGAPKDISERLLSPSRLPSSVQTPSSATAKHHSPVIIDSLTYSPVEQQNTAVTPDRAPTGETDQSDHFPQVIEEIVNTTTTTCRRTVVDETTTEEILLLDSNSFDYDSVVRPEEISTHPRVMTTTTTTTHHPTRQPVTHQRQPTGAVATASKTTDQSGASETGRVGVAAVDVPRIRITTTTTPAISATPLHDLSIGVNEHRPVRYSSIENYNSFLGVPTSYGGSGRKLSQSSPELSPRNNRGGLTLIRESRFASGSRSTEPARLEFATGQPMTSTLRYSLPPSAGSNIITQVPITGSSFKNDYPTTAQLLAQQQQRDVRYDYLFNGGTGSPVSTGTLPYTVDGTKVIYPPVAGKKPNHSYASSRVSTTSELDGYAPSPSPSIPDSTFSLVSRGSTGRLSRRSHATIYLKGTDANSRHNSRSKVDLTVESENGVPVDQLQHAPIAAQQHVLGRRSSASSSSSGRGIQKLTIKMVLKEKKGDNNTATPADTAASSRSIQPAQVRRTSPPLRVSSSSSVPAPQVHQKQADLPHSIRQDDLPNGATAASTSYRRQEQSRPEGEPPRVVRAVSSHASRYYSSAPVSKPRLSSSEVELSQPEILTTTTMPERHIPIYERRPPSGVRDSVVSRAYSQASSFMSRDPSKPKPYRSYERLDIINDDGGRVMREVVEELRGDHISIQVHEKGDGLSEAKVAKIKDDERHDLERLEKSQPTLEMALTSEGDGIVLPEKPISPPRSRREKYELYQAISYQRDITDEDPNGSRRTPVSFHEIEYEVRDRPSVHGRPKDAVVREETRVAESRAVSAPAIARPILPPPPVTIETRPRYAERQPVAPSSHNHTPTWSSPTYTNNTEHQSHISYRSIFDKCYTDERINELRKSASDLRALTNGGTIEPWSIRRDPSTTTTTRPAPTATSSSKYDYPRRPASPPPARPLPPYREPLSTTRPSVASYQSDSRPSSYAPIVPPRDSSIRSSGYNPTEQREYSKTESYTRESLTKTTTSSSTNYRPVEKDPEYKYITQYKSTPTLVPTSTASLYREPYSTRKPDDIKATSTYPARPEPTSFRYEPPVSTKSSYVPYVSSSVGITSLPRSTNSYGQPITSKPTETYVTSRPHLSTVDALAHRSQPPLPREFIAATKGPMKPKDSFAYKPYESGTMTATSKLYESGTTSASSTFEKPKSFTTNEPRSTGSSWAYAVKLPDEQYRSTSADRPDSRSEARRELPLKTVEPAVIEALKPKRHEAPSSPYVPPKDYVPPCKAKILKRKFMQQPVSGPPLPIASDDEWDRYKNGSRDRIQLRISRESLDAINKEATRGRQTRTSAPDLRGSAKTLANPGVYRSKIQWPEQEIQAKLSESQEYLARRYQAEYGDDPTTSSFANRWDSRSRSLPPMSRYSKSAANTPSETPYPEYMDSSKAKSMEFLADVKKYDYNIVPENQLQRENQPRENISGYARPRPAEDSEYGDQIRKSLQKLDLPDWYVNSPYSQPGVMEGAILRNRAPSTTHSDYSTYATMDRSEVASPTGTMQSSDAQVLSRRVVPRDTDRHSKPNLSTSRDDKIWEGYTAPVYNKKTTRPSAIYSPASETHHRQHDSGYWNNHPESSQDSDSSTNGRGSPRAWNSNAPTRVPNVQTPLSTSSSSAWYVPPLQRREHSAPSRSSYPDRRAPEDLYRREVPPYPASVTDSTTRPITTFDQIGPRRIIQSTPWEVTSIKTETIKTEKLAKKNFVTETNDPVKVSQLSRGNTQWGSYV